MAKMLSKKERADMKVLAQFVSVFCARHHHARRAFEFNASGFDGVLPSLELCDDCGKLLRYGLTMRLRCPHEPKPMCKKCPRPCYKPDYRERIREVMKFSGMYLVKRGRIDLLYHYFR